MEINNVILKRAEQYQILAAFRQPDAISVAQSLSKILKSTQSPSGIETLRGTGELMHAAEQIVLDLQAFGRGELPWKEIPRGLLLCGLPGSGKTFVAGCIAASAEVGFVATTTGQWQSRGHLGDLLKAMRDDFARARALAPCILFVDEIDGLGSRQSADSHGQNYRRQVINEFLALVDGVEAAEGVMLIGATNHVEALDPALLRTGRLDRLIAVPLPDQRALEQLLRYHLQADLPDLDLSVLARLAKGSTPAAVAGAVRLARAQARAEKIILSGAHLSRQLRPEYDVLPEREWIVSLHEAGHAFACHLLSLGTVLEMRLDREGGLTRVHLTPITGTLQSIQNLLTFHLSGRAAEMVVLGQVTAGSGGDENSDLAKATALALQIERSLGVGANDLLWETANHSAQCRPMSISERHQVIGHLNAAHSNAVTLLQANKDSLVTLANRLAFERQLLEEEITPLLPLRPMAEANLKKKNSFYMPRKRHDHIDFIKVPQAGP